MAEYVLGLDLGSNSVGWAMITPEDETLDNDLSIFAGARVFPEGLDQLNQKKEKPRGQDRRMARGQRRTHQRRSSRREQLAEILQSAGMFPKDIDELSALLAAKPYPLRAKGLDESLSPYEFGRVLYHLCQRRGFKSNRKQEKSKEDGKVKKETDKLQGLIEAADCRTLGEYLAKLDDAFRHTDTKSLRIRNRYTLRVMYEHEFALLWDAQAAFHPNTLTDDLKKEVHHAIFFQRPITWDKDKIGECELEEGEKRCPKAHWLGQQSRLLQEINLLRVLDAGGEERPLNADERTKLVAALSPKTKLTFDQIRKLLQFFDWQTFNLESQSKRKDLKGNPVENALQRKALKKWYNDASSELREEIYTALAEIEDEDELRTLAVEQWKLDEKQVEDLLKISLPTKRFNVSIKAMRKMMPFLETGCIYSDAKEKAGYALTQKIETRDSLPPIDEAVEYLTNPLVHRALSETRKVVNAIVRKYGVPKEIVVELARDMKNSAQKRKDIFFDNLKHRKENEEARERLIQEFGVPNPSRDDIIKYKLWEECDGICVYTGRIISKAQLVSGEVQIEHILPYSRTLDDSYMNKTLCYADENRDRKGNKTPYEAYNSDPELYEKIQQRIRPLPYPKRRRFTQKEIDLDKFAERQLNDTRYMSRVAIDYLRMLGCNVRSVKGQTTSELRHQWGLNDILNPLAPNMKNRDDHRHHAVDAAVIAMTTRSALQKLSTVKYNPERPRLDPPWENFRDDLEKAVNAINVSFRPARKIAGKLHKDTAYGPGKTKGSAVLRVPVGKLTPKMIEEIRDLKIREIIQQAVLNADRENKKLGDKIVCMPSGVPIKKVRIERTEKTLVPIRKDENGREIKFVKPGENHHVEIYEKEDGTWTGRAVSRFETHQRLRRKEPVINRNLDDGSKFVMSLCIDDMVLLDNPPKPDIGRLYRIQNTSVSSPLLTLRLHTTAKTDDKEEAIKKTRLLVAIWETFQSWKPKKVTVDPLGRILPCND